MHVQKIPETYWMHHTHTHTYIYIYIYSINSVYILYRRWLFKNYFMRLMWENNTKKRCPRRHDKQIIKDTKKLSLILLTKEQMHCHYLAYWYIDNSGWPLFCWFWNHLSEKEGKSFPFFFFKKISNLLKKELLKTNSKTHVSSEI